MTSINAFSSVMPHAMTTLPLPGAQASQSVTHGHDQDGDTDNGASDANTSSGTTGKSLDILA